MARPRILCLDLSGVQTGAAYGIAGGQPLLETWDMPATASRPEKFVLLDGMLERFCADHQVDEVYFERPLPISVLMAIGAREETVEMLRGLAATVEQFAARHGIKVSSWDVQRARRAVLGTGRFKRGTAKQMVMAGVKTLGYRPANDNEGDALVGFLFQSALANPRWASIQGPLFAATA